MTNGTCPHCGDAIADTQANGCSRCKAERSLVLKIEQEPPEVLVGMTKKQAEILVKALDVWSRMPMAQLKEILSHATSLLADRWMQAKSCPSTRTAVEEALLVLKANLFPELAFHVGYSIHSPEVPDAAKIAYDLQRVIRGDKVRDPLGSEPVAKVERVNK